MHIFSLYLIDVINFEQPDLALTYVVVLSSRIPKILILVFYHLLLIHFCPLEALAKKCKNIPPVSTDFKNSFVWLTGVKKVIFHYNNFFDSGHFLIFFSDLMNRKMAGVKKVVKIKSQFFHACQPRKGNFEMCSKRYCILQFLARTSNGQKCVRSKW